MNACKMCDTTKVNNAGFLMCPHCDSPCFAALNRRKCEECETMNKRTRQ